MYIHVTNNIEYSYFECAGSASYIKLKVSNEHLKHQQNDDMAVYMHRIESY